MKSTILTESDSMLMEKLLVTYSRIVTTDQLLAVFKTKYSKQSAQNRIQILTKAGWLKRIKRGLYLVIENISSRYQNDSSLLLISNALNRNSYVSLSYALNYYHMFDQQAKSIVAITTLNSKKYYFDNFVFKFCKVKNDMYFGYSKKIDSGKAIGIASAEKALIDYLYLDSSFTSASLVFEKLNNYQQSIDMNKLQEYSLHSGTAVTRKIGFLLDQLKIDTSTLYKGLENNTGLTRFTRESTTFNAKWRIYYDDRIIG